MLMSSSERPATLFYQPNGYRVMSPGNHVICVDINAEKVQMMKDGKVPIYEPHLDVLFERNIRQGRLSFTTDLKSAIDGAQIIFT